MKNTDRHLGRRESIWFTDEEHRRMLEAMEIMKFGNNKSAFIRSAVASYVNIHMKKEESK